MEKQELTVKNIINFDTSDGILDGKFSRAEVDLPQRIGKHDMLWGEPSGPPASWKAGAPLGNGNFGVMVYGYPDNISFALGKTDIWDRVGMKKSRFPEGSFSDFTQTYFDKDEQKFKELCATVDGVGETQHATTAGMFRLRVHDASGIISPSLSVSLYDAIARLKFKPCGTNTSLDWHQENTIEMFVSRPHKVLAIQIDPGDCPPRRIAWELSREPHDNHPRAQSSFQDGIGFLTQQFSDGWKYSVGVAVQGATLELTSFNDRLLGNVLCDTCDKIYIYLTLISCDESNNTENESILRLQKAISAGYNKIRSEHSAWWAKYWHKSYVYVADEALEKWWYHSLYLTGSIIEPGCQSPGLQGVWVKENVPAWWGDYHSNINLQAVYWQLLTTNRIEFFDPYIKHLIHITEQVRKDTKEYFNMSGMRFPHSCTIDGYELTTGPWGNLGTSVGGSSWLTQLLWQIYEYTSDKKYLEQVAYPFLKEVVFFYEDYLRFDEKSGRYNVEPSVFFEALMPGFSSWGSNSLYELSLVYSAFGRAIAAAETLGIDDTDCDRWKTKLVKLADFPKDWDGNGWVGFEGRDVRKYGSHQFSMPPVFPNELVSIWHGPEQWRKDAEATLSHPLTTAGNVGTGKAWCGGQGIREIIRMGCVEQAAEAARWSAKDNTNGLVHTWGSYYLQADHGPGMAGVLSDMLLLSIGGAIRLFPCFPKDIPAGFCSLRASGAFLITAEKRSSEVDYAVMKSLAGNTLKIANPWTGNARIRDYQSGEVLIESNENELTVCTHENQTLILDRPGNVFEQFNILKW